MVENDTFYFTSIHFHIYIRIYCLVWLQICFKKYYIMAVFQKLNEYLQGVYSLWMKQSQNALSYGL